MFSVGELLKRKTLRANTRSYSVVVDKDDNNYTVYNNSLKCIQTVACVVVNELYSRVIEEDEELLAEEIGHSMVAEALHA